MPKGTLPIYLRFFSPHECTNGEFWISDIWQPNAGSCNVGDAIFRGVQLLRRPERRYFRFIAPLLRGRAPGPPALGHRPHQRWLPHAGAFARLSGALKPIQECAAKYLPQYFFAVFFDAGVVGRGRRLRPNRLPNLCWISVHHNVDIGTLVAQN